MKNELPNGWAKCQLEDFVQILDNLRKPVNSSEREERLQKAKNLYPYYGATGQVGYIDNYLTDGDFILLGEDGAPFLDPYKSKAYLIRGKTWVNNHAHILKGYGNIDDQFICYWLNSIQYRPFVSGTTRLKLNQAMMKTIPCCLPPVAEQKRIVEKIEELFAEMDRGIEILKQKQAELKKYRQSVLNAAFSGKFYKTTEWKSCQLKEVCDDIQYGYTESSSKSKIGPKFLRITDIQNDSVDWEEVPYCKISDTNLQKYKLQENDFVFARTGATVGKSYLLKNIPEIAIFASYLIRVRFKTKIISKFVKYFFQSPKYWMQIVDKQSGIGQPNVNGTKLGQLEIILPTLPEQEQIVSEIEQRFAGADVLEKNIAKALQKAEQLKQSILKKAFEGKLVPQDPNDEPANVLLERIKSEQANSSPKKKGKKK